MFCWSLSHSKAIYCIILGVYLITAQAFAVPESRLPITFSKNRYVCVISSQNSVEVSRTGKILQASKLLRKIRTVLRRLKVSGPVSGARNKLLNRNRALYKEIKLCISGQGRYTFNAPVEPPSNDNPDATPTPEPARLEVSDWNLDFGFELSNRTLTLSNEREEVVTFEILSSDSWINVSPANGEIRNTSISINVAVDRTDLWLGASTSRLRLLASDGTDNEITVQVSKSGVPAPKAQVVAWLRELQPLPKQHFTWKPWYSFYHSDNDELLYEFIRINNGISIADWPNAAIIDKVVQLCKQVNDTNPTIPASIMFVDSPYTTYWPAGAPPTYNGPERAQELNRYADQLSTLTNYLAVSNARYPGPDIQISHVALDIELWGVKAPGEQDYLEWNNAMRANYDALYDIIKTYLPQALIDWYSRGWIRFFGNYEPPAWATGPYVHFDLSEAGDTCSAVMYRLPMQNASREVFTRTTDYCAAFGVDTIIPWLALGAGYKPTDDNTNVYYTPDWNYDLQVSWNFGHQINDPSDPAWGPAQWVMIYPAPFQDTTPYYAQHYVAYVRGAQGIPNLPQ